MTAVKGILRLIGLNQHETLVGLGVTNTFLIRNYNQHQENDIAPLTPAFEPTGCLT